MPRSPRSRLNPGRLAAAQALLAVERGALLAEALSGRVPADPADRAQAWSLALGVLRHRAELDAAVVAVARRSTRTLDPGVLAALRIGAWELRLAGVPPHAAVDQAVELTRALGLGHAAGLVNAVLRRVGTVEVPEAARRGFPDWLLARWRPRFGPGLEAALDAAQRPAPAWMVAAPDRAGVLRQLQHQGVGAVPGPGDSFRITAEGPVAELPGWDEGRFWPLDPRLAALAEAVPAGTVEVRGSPGLSWLLAARGRRVVPGGDPARVARTREGAATRGIPLADPVDRADVVVLVLAGTGLGSLRRLPELRWRRRPEDPPATARQLAEAARAAVGRLRPGGTLLYAVHSLEPEEGPEVVAGLGGTATVLADGLPDADGGDWIYAARVAAPEPG